MTVRVPVAGYPSVRAAVMALTAKNMRAAAIAEQIGRSEQYVRTVWSQERRRAGKAGTSVVISRETFDALRPHAAKRGVDASELVRLLLDQVVADQMVDAVMDDGGD